MARPREFDEASVLAAAVQQFWTRGYEATSIRDLAENMGMAGASLYNAFGDKRALFRRALEFYVEQSFGDLVGRLEGALPPREVLAAFFSEIIECSMSDAERKGCMVVNSALEVAPHDPEFRRVIAGVLTQVEAFFRRCVDAGQRDGTIAKRRPANDLARLLLGALLGIRVLARARPERELLAGIVRTVFALLDDHPKRHKSRRN
jgi:TetR/AcrR family transcriptional regulator, transcriptional repressor for nem operon